MIYAAVRDESVMELIAELLAIPAPSGREERLAAFIRDRVVEWGYEAETDPAGNVLVRVDGSHRDAPLVCVAAHMDEIALVVTGIEENGDLRVINSGGLLPFKLGERAMTVVGDHADVRAIFSFGSTHRPGAESMGAGWEHARLITGLSAVELSDAGVRPGSTAVPATDGRGPYVLGSGEDPLVSAWTFDDRAGVAALLEALRVLKDETASLRVRFLAAFTVHEEGGSHGAKVLAHRERPAAFIALDGCPVVPGSCLRLDGRPGIWSKDQETHYDQRLIRDLCALAVATGTGIQPVVYERAASDAGRAYSSGACPRTAVFGQVRRNSHGFEVARRSVFGNVARLLTAFLTSWEG